MNEHESENIEALIEYMGYNKTDKMTDADLIILNTCSIRENANNKVFGMLGRAKHIKETKNRSQCATGESRNEIATGLASSD